jgi:hypothetical protein
MTMRRRGLAVVALVGIPLLLGTRGPARAAEVAPRISDREIIERLVRVEEGLKGLRAEMAARFEGVDKRFDDLQRGIDARFAGLDKRFEAIDKRFDDLNRRIDMLMWMVGVFVTTATVVLGFVVRIQWQMSRRLTRVETTLETHKDEIAFLKGLIEKLLPPRGAL